MRKNILFFTLMHRTQHWEHTFHIYKMDTKKLWNMQEKYWPRSKDVMVQKKELLVGVTFTMYIRHILLGRRFQAASYRSQLSNMFPSYRRPISMRVDLCVSFVHHCRSWLISKGNSFIEVRKCIQMLMDFREFHFPPGLWLLPFWWWPEHHSV